MPFITNKGSHFTKNIILCEKDEIINDQNMVAECFNDFFINVAKDIGNVTVVDKNHPRIIVCLILALCGASVDRSNVFCVVFCRSLFVLY
jgi:hypothetical protein